MLLETVHEDVSRHVGDSVLFPPSSTSNVSGPRLGMTLPSAEPAWGEQEGPLRPHRRRPGVVQGGSAAGLGFPPQPGRGAVPGEARTAAASGLAASPL